MTKIPEVRFLDRTTPPATITLVLLAGVSALNMSIFLPSLSGMTAYFDTTYSVMQIAVSGYFLCTAILQLIVGPLSDRIGRRPVVLGSLALFVLGTIGAIFAPNIWVFLICRIIQASVASCMALSRAVVRDVYPTDQAASRIGYVTMGMSIVPMIGPVIGGGLDELFDWRASFVFLAISAIAILALTYRDLGETSRSQGMTIGQQFAQYPLLLKSVRFWGYVACTSFCAGAFYALLGGASYVAENVYSLSPRDAGLALGMPALGYFFGNYLSGRYAVKYGINALSLAGCILSVVSLLISAALVSHGHDTPLVFFGMISIMGLGNGLTMPNATTGSLSIKPEIAGTASGLATAIMMGSGAIMSALASSMLSGDNAAFTLASIMAASAAASLVSILLVIWRERQQGLSAAI